MKSKLIIGLLAVVAALLIVNITMSKSCPFKRMCNAPTESVSVNDVEPFKQTPFQAVTEKLQPGGDVYSYYKTEDVIKGLTGFICEIIEMAGEQDKMNPSMYKFLNNLLANSGVGEISAFGESLIQVDEKMYSYRNVLHRKNGGSKGLIWKMFGSENINFGSAKELVPESAAYATCSTLNAKLIAEWIYQQLESCADPEVKKRVDESLQMVEVMTGKDVWSILGSLDNQLVIIVSLNSERQAKLDRGVEVDEIHYALALKVKDSTVYDIFKKFIPVTEVEYLQSGNKSYIQFKEEKTTTGLYKPVLCQSEEYFVCATNKVLCDELFSKKENPELITLSKPTPESGVSFTYLSSKAGSFFNSFVEKFSQKQIEETRMLFGEASPSELLAQKIVKKLFTVPKCVSVLQVEDSGYYTTANTSQGTAQSMSSAVVIPAIIAAVAVPALEESREKAQEHVKDTNVKIVEVAVLSYLANNPGKVLEDIVWSDISSSLDKNRNSLKKLKVGSIIPVFKDGVLVYDLDLYIQQLSLEVESLELATSLHELAIAAAEMNFSKGHHFKEDVHVKIVDGKSLLKVMDTDIGKEWQVEGNSLSAILNGRKYIIKVKSPESKGKQAVIDFVVE